MSVEKADNKKLLFHFQIEACHPQSVMNEVYTRNESYIPSKSEGRQVCIALPAVVSLGQCLPVRGEFRNSLDKEASS